MYVCLRLELGGWKMQSDNLNGKNGPTNDAIEVAALSVLMPSEWSFPEHRRILPSSRTRRKCWPGQLWHPNYCFRNESGRYTRMINDLWYKNAVIYCLSIAPTWMRMAMVLAIFGAHGGSITCRA